MPEPGPPVQFFAVSPRLHQLTSLLVVFEKPGDKAPGKQVLRCRELIFRCATVLASPSDEADSVMVLVPRAFSLFQTLADMRARVLGERPASCDDLACCLRYTLRAKLAPQWNMVGDLLLQGRDFLQVTGPINGVRLQVNVTEEDICLSTQACVVRLPRLSLNDLGASPGVLGDFHAGLTDVIRERQLTGRWCHILPRMTKGQVATVTRQLLPAGPFAAYRDLKRHWKNMYGYRLPDEAPPYYVNINFRLVGPQLFTYPPLCLRNGPPVFLARPAQRPILVALLRDLHVKVGSVCGRPLTFSGTPSYLTVQLQPAPEFQADVRPNLSSTPVARQPPVATRQVGHVANVDTETRPLPKPQETAGPSVASANPAPLTQQQGQISGQPHQEQQQERKQQLQQESRQQLQQQQRLQQQQQHQQPSPPKRSRQDQPPGLNQTPTNIPSCLPRTPRPATPARFATSTGVTSVPTTSKTPSGCLNPLPRSPTPGQLATGPDSHPSPGDSTGSVTTPASPRPARIVPVFKSRPVGSSQAAAGFRQGIVTGKQGTAGVKVPGGATGLGKPMAVGRTAMAAGKAAQKAQKAVAGKAKAANSQKGADDRPTQVEAGQSKGSQSSRGPQDIPSLCRRGQLHRASISTLQDWLKERGRTSTGRPSKAQLIAQVQDCLRGEVAAVEAGVVSRLG